MKNENQNQNEKHIILSIKGMYCPGCEGRIERVARRLPGVKAAQASYRQARLDIAYDAETKLDFAALGQAIKKIGYEVEDRSLKPESAPLRPFRLAQLLIVVIAVYMILKATGGFYFLPQIDQSMGYGLLFGTGLLVSLHCIAMCGGINLSQTLSRSQARFMPSLLYNGGRVISYTLLGGVVGALGSVVSFSGAAKGIVAILSGILMILIGLNMLDLFAWARRLMPSLPKSFSRIFHSERGNGPFFVGLLNGLMPCGPLQAMQLYALGTGSFWGGALAMFLFSLGTVPLMFVFGVLGSLLSSRFTRKMLQAGGVFILVLGIVLFNRGLGLSGVNLLPALGASASSTAQIQGDVQVVTTELKSGSYAPITVYKGIPVRWTIKADADSLNGCNNSLNISTYAIEKKLEPGDNVIQFTPTQTGTFEYTCWMGMIRSTIKVVDKSEQ